MVSTTITRQRMENQIISTKITRPKVVQYKNNSPKGWMSGELNGQHENNSAKDGESNSKHENNSPKGCTVQKNNSPNGWMGGELNDWHEK